MKQQRNNDNWRKYSQNSIKWAYSIQLKTESRDINVPCGVEWIREWRPLRVNSKLAKDSLVAEIEDNAGDFDPHFFREDDEFEE